MNKLQPHKDVVNKLPDILIVGAGWVGQDMYRLFPTATLMDEYGLVEGKRKEYYDFAFVCVPTPPEENGECDISIVASVLDKYIEDVGIFIVKSTVSLHSLDMYENDTIFSPEYIGETTNHPINKDEFVILGGQKELVERVGQLYTLVTNSQFEIRYTDLNTAILAKLMENAFYSTKVAFCNQMYDIAKNNSIDYIELRELWLLDKRISRDHTYVYPENRGFAGKCLPKDLDNLIESNIYVSFLLRDIRAYNKLIRSNNNE